jgi:hypothetical protein
MINTEIVKMVDPFNRPIPGQSLTNPVDTPYPWEGPPEFVKVNEAIEYIFKSIIGDSQRLTALLEVLDSKTLPIAGMAQILLESGFRQGKWNPDLMLLLAEPTMVILMAIAERAGIGDYEIYQGENAELDEEEQREITNEVINSFKEEVNFKGLRKQGGIDVRSVPKEILEEIEETPLPEVKEKQPSLLGER